VQSWVIVFIGFGEGIGGILGSFLFEQVGFRWQYDIIACFVILGFIAILILDSRYQRPTIDVNEDKTSRENSE